MCLSLKAPEDQSYLNGGEVKQIIRWRLIQLSDCEETHPPRQGVYPSWEILHLVVHHYLGRFFKVCSSLSTFLIKIEIKKKNVILEHRNPICVNPRPIILKFKNTAILASQRQFADSWNLSLRWCHGLYLNWDSKSLYDELIFDLNPLNEKQASTHPVVFWERPRSTGPTMAFHCILIMHDVVTTK